MSIETKDYIRAFFTVKNDLSTILANRDIDTTNYTKYNTLVPLVSLIETGTGYSHATVICNRIQNLTITGFNFLPSSFAIVSEYALEHTYSVVGTAYNVIGALQLDGLELGQQTHTVEIMLGDSVSTINVHTNLTMTLGIATLIVTLPNGYYFMGESEWAVLGNTSWDDEDDEDEEL